MTTESYGEKPVSIGDWILTFILMSLPLVGLFFLFYWAFSDSTAPSKKNYCRAALILFVIGIGLGLLFLFAFGGLALLAGSQAGVIR
ncbi:hypothetical protein OpiT1DRAFT_03016 [Opitutaceae bacterium TAV1]|nr:hypothetical protein OpiT1DRAFT_03016 [Opitutaceae bacterium TAV1]